MNRNCRRPDSWNYRLRAMKLGGGWRPLTALSLTVALLVLLMPWAAEAQGTNVSEPSDGDLPGNTTTTGFVTIGGTVSGNVGEGGDVDWYGVELTEGAYYKFSLHGAAMANSQVTLRGLADENGSYVTPAPGTYRWSSIYWKPSKTGIFYLDVGPYQDERNGAYTLSASLIEAAEDTIPADIMTTAEVGVGGSRLYAIQTAHDHDWIKVDFEEGVRYRVVLDVITQPGRRGWADMFYPALVHIRDPDGDPIANTSNVYDVGVGLPTWWRQDRAETYYRAAVEGTHYIVAGSSVNTTGIFGVWVVQTMDDDYSGNESTTGTVTVDGAAASGKIEVPSDRDWFKTSLTEGKTYKVNVLGKSTGDGSLRWPKLTGIYNSSGERFPNTGNDDHGFGVNPRKYFTASQTGDYFIGVAGYSLGTYKVSLEEVGADIPGDITTTASLTIDGTVTSEFDRINDDDWHKLQVTADQPYIITMSGDAYSCVYIRNIYDSNGNVVTDLGSGLTKPDNNTSQWYFKRTEVGTYYVSVGECSHPDGQGGYDLSTPTGTYTVTVISVSEDATLSGLTLSGIELDPSFDSELETYTAAVTNNQTETTVTPMVNHLGATYVIKIDGVTDSDGTVTLAADNNLITVKVKAEDGVTKKTYKVTVTRAASQQTQTVGPGITGSPTVGETVTADTSEIEDANGLINASFSYQWERQDLVTEDVTDILGATGATYEVTSDDRDSAIRVSVSYTDDDGNNVTLTSFWVLTITPPNNLPTGAPTISGTAQVGETLTADTSDIGDADGLTNVSYSYQWVANDGTSDSDITGETASTYTLVDADEGKTVRVKVSFTDDAANEETLTSAATAEVAGEVTAGVRAEPPGRPRNLTGAANADGTVTLSWDAPNDDSVTGYQILRRRPREGEGTLLVHVNDTGSTATEYTDNDVTPDVLHAYRVKAINAVGLSRQSNFVNMTPALPAEPAQNSPATGRPAISGTAQVGETLTADTSGISDADGLADATFAYQWLADGTGIDGATGDAYILTTSEMGKIIKVRVSFTDDAGNEETLTSTATGTVSPAVQPQTANSSATGVPTVTGTAQVGETLSVDTSGIADADGLTNVSYSYRWVANDEGTDADISSETDATYTLVAADVGDTIKVKVTFTDDAGNEETLTSGATDAVAAADPPAMPTGLSPSVSHAAVTLTWDDPQDDSITGYVILRRDRAIHPTGTFVTITGDTGSADTAYTDDTVEPDREYVYRIKAINEHGEVSEMSDWVRGFTPAAPPTDSPATGEPTISGTVRVGQTLTVDTSGIADADGLNNAVFAYQWLSDDADIGGATGSTYTLVDDDEGRTIKVRVTVTDDVGNETTLTSAATEAVEAVEAKRNTAATGRPIISGTVRVGETLTADTTGIGDADGLANVSYSYQWVVTDGGAYIDISGETRATYTLASADRGLYILVRVSFADDAGKRETLTSAATDMVEAAP